MDLTDDEFADLLAQARGGDAAAKWRLVELTEPQLVGPVAKILGPGRPSDIEDTVRNAILQARMKVDGFRGTTRAEFVAWSCTIAKNLAIDALKRSARQVAFDDRRDQPAASPAQA